MSEELRPCPFCGHPAKIVWQSPQYKAAACINDECPIGPEGDADPYCLTLDEWNCRPLEDALAARVAELEERVDFWHNCSNAHEGCRDTLRDMYAKMEAERDRLREALGHIAVGPANPESAGEARRLCSQYVIHARRAILRDMEEKP